MKLVKTLSYAVLCCAVLVGCRQNVSERLSLYEEGLSVIETMRETAANRKVAGFFGLSEEMSASLDVVKGDYSTPKTVYAVSLDKEALALLCEAEGINLNGLSDNITDVITDKTVASVVTRINAMGGANVLAASAVCNVSETFLPKEPTDNVLYLYVYEDTAPAAVTFIAGKDGTASANGSFILTDIFDAADETSVAAFFGELGLDDIAVVYERK